LIPDKRQCFVMMPSGNHGEYKHGKREADYIFYAIITPAIQTIFGSDMKIIREVDNRSPGAINKGIIEHIAESDLAIVDITGQNPNVFLELGIRYALRQSTTVLLRQEDTVIPFDITNFRCIEYAPLFDGIEKAKDDLTLTLRAIAAQDEPQCDSLVFEVLPELSVNLPFREDAEGYGVRTMPWEVYWERLQIIKSKLENVFKDGNYNPTVIVGITNGGAMYADLLVREIFEALPAVTLWADRRNAAANYFDNELNKAIVTGVRSLVEEGRGELNILLVDDIVASGTTVINAVAFLQEHLPGARLLFLPLFSRNDSYLGIIKKHLLWKDPVFSISDDEAKSLHSTGWPILPYKKDIRST
jgi:pyrimidine operon attenuation protein/uracil phosphoribosyltransferase